MSNSFKLSRTSLCVGYGQQGDDCEGGNCGHLKEGQQAFGRRQEIDSMGSESYLVCEACYKEMMAARMEESVACNDCGRSFKRSEVVTYTPYEEFAEREYQRVKLHICKACQKQEIHLDRLRRDKRMMEDDLKNFDGSDIDEVF